MLVEQRGRHKEVAAQLLANGGDGSSDQNAGDACADAVKLGEGFKKKGDVYRARGRLEWRSYMILLSP